MSTIKSEPIKAAFTKLVRQKPMNKQPALFSYVEKVDWIDPLLFYKNGASVYKGERFFWKDRDGQVEMVGLGNIYTLRSEEGDEARYEEVEKKWNNMIKCAVVHNPYTALGTGPALFGGFSFDPNRPQAEEWAKFSSAFFYLPEYMLTVYEGNCYITINILCRPEELHSLIDHLESRKDEVLTHTDTTALELPASLLKKEEYHQAQWIKGVNEAVERMEADTELKKVVLARKIVASFDQAVSHDGVLERLIAQQPDSFIFSLEAMDSCFLGASPERLVRKRGEKVLSTCLAGSIKRSKNPEEDEALGKELLNDEKNRKEHDYVVQMIKEEMEGLCKHVSIPSAPELMKVRDIQHLHTPVVGLTEAACSILQFVEKLHPTPALGGLPNDKALPIIRQLEGMDRGLYGAPVGWMDSQGNGEFAVAIRSGLLEKEKAFLYAGCGIVADSDPDSELAETQIKFRPMLRALGGSSDE
ncbi:isochorismate synthase [Bacillus thermotolerans]|uniref:isochorismate synthase n=1 Tax=Bacillus thermotolerans TaxID=1221996 RepID=UPI0005804397|nr:isochorismate synthase [Bacillus thermotolerans]KKB33146.1 Menaquinone-specific isochorismate synthase [Bacillus thermotolerans]